MTTDLTVQPTRTSASLGPALTDPGFPVAEGYQPTVPQLDRWADWLVQLAASVGIPTTTDPLTILGMLQRLGQGDPTKYRYTEHFDFRAAGALDERWIVDTGSILSIDDVGTYIEAPLDGGVENLLRMVGYHFYRTSLPAIESRMIWTDAINSPVTRLGFRNAAGNGGWGVEWNHAADTHFRVYSLIGGAYAYAASTVLGADLTWHKVRVWLTGTAGVQTVNANIDGTVVTLGAQAIAQSPWSPLLTVGSGGPAGKKFRADYAVLEADFSIADA
jgi:hypothetical protein